MTSKKELIAEINHLETLMDDDNASEEALEEYLASYNAKRIELLKFKKTASSKLTDIVAITKDFDFTIKEIFGGDSIKQFDKNEIISVAQSYDIKEVFGSDAIKLFAKGEIIELAKSYGIKEVFGPGALNLFSDYEITVTANERKIMPSAPPKNSDSEDTKKPNDDKKPWEENAIVLEGRHLKYHKDRINWNPLNKQKLDPAKKALPWTKTPVALLENGETTDKLLTLATNEGKKWFSTPEGKLELRQIVDYIRKEKGLPALPKDAEDSAEEKPAPTDAEEVKEEKPEPVADEAKEEPAPAEDEEEVAELERVAIDEVANPAPTSKRKKS